MGKLILATFFTGTTLVLGQAGALAAPMVTDFLVSVQQNAESSSEADLASAILGAIQGVSVPSAATPDEAAALFAEAIAGAIPLTTTTEDALAAIDEVVSENGDSLPGAALIALAAVRADIVEASESNNQNNGNDTDDSEDQGPPPGGAGEDEGDDPAYVPPSA